MDQCPVPTQDAGRLHQEQGPGRKPAAKGSHASSTVRDVLRPIPQPPTRSTGVGALISDMHTKLTGGVKRAVRRGRRLCIVARIEPELLAQRRATKTYSRLSSSNGSPAKPP